MRKIPFLMLALLCAFQLLNAQNQSLESKAFAFFCDSITKTAFFENEDAIYFSGWTMGKPTSIHTLGLLMYFLNTEPIFLTNQAYFDSCGIVNEHKIYKKEKIKTKCHMIRRFVLKKNHLMLKLYHAIEYKGYYYVQISLLDVYGNRWLYMVKFDSEREKAIGYLKGCF